VRASEYSAINQRLFL